MFVVVMAAPDVDENPPLLFKPGDDFPASHRYIIHTVCMIVKEGLNIEIVVLFITKLDVIGGLKREAEAVALKGPSSTSCNLAQRALRF
jgi:hypothetical protein